MRPFILLAMLAPLALSACQRQPPQFQVEDSRSYDLPKETVWEDTLAFLRANDITVRDANPATGEIQAFRHNYPEEGWAWCEPDRVSDRSSDTRRLRRNQVALDRSLELNIEVRENGDMMEVAPDAEFTERQVHAFTNWPYDVPCRSTGALERALLDAI